MGLGVKTREAFTCEPGHIENVLNERAIVTIV